MNSRLTSLILLFCCACATQVRAPVDILLGHWHGEYELNGDRHQWLIERKSDGTYRLMFQRCRDQQLIWSHTEIGNWRIQQNYYTKIARLIIDEAGLHRPDTPRHVYLNAYEVLDLDEEEFSYRHSLNKANFHSYRVSADFSLSCQS